MDFLHSDDLQSLEGAVTGVRLVAHVDGKWIPLRVDQDMERSYGGLVASGLSLRPAYDLCSEVKLMLELPRRGDLSRVFIRRQSAENAVTGDEPSYRAAPYLLCVNGVLCIRHLPGPALVQSLA